MFKETEELTFTTPNSHAESELSSTLDKNDQSRANSAVNQSDSKESGQNSDPVFQSFLKSFKRRRELYRRLADS